MRAAMSLLIVAFAFPSTHSRADSPPATGWEFTGVAQASATAEVRARVTGIVTRVAVPRNPGVAKGDLLIELDARPYQLALKAAQAEQKVAQAQVDSTQVKVENARELHENQVVGPQEVALHEAALAEAEAELALAEVQVQRAELTLSWTRITAPFDGRISRLSATAGEIVVADQTAILTILRTDPLTVAFNVPESLVLQLRRDGLSVPGKLSVAVGFAGEDGYPHAAEMESIAAEVNSRTRNAQFQATVANPEDLLLPGMSARVRLTPAS